MTQAQMEQKKAKKKTDERSTSKKTQAKSSRKAGKSQPAAEKRRAHNIDLGRRGEDAAASFLERRGFSILERNWKCRAGEADIIALDDEAIHFVEVKTRISDGNGFPAEAVDEKKRRRYETIAELYLSHYDGFETGVTFDVVAINVLPNERALIRIYKNVLSCDCGMR